MKVAPAALKTLANNDLENFVTASTSGGIEAQEAAGQKKFVESTMLPKDMSHGCTKEKLEKMGIKFKEDADNIFVNVVLPEGWHKEPTDHSMWSNLIDNKGRKRAAIFYKAAFYDRYAYISLNRRFYASYGPEDGYKSGVQYEERKNGNWCGIVEDCNNVIFKTGPIKNPSDYQRDELIDKVVAWLKDKYPDYANELAYWDE